MIEVRDSRTGYFIPVRYGLGDRPDGRVVGASSALASASPGSSGRHSGQGTIFEVFQLDLDSDERYLDFETVILYRISLHNSLA